MTWLRTYGRFIRNFFWLRWAPVLGVLLATLILAIPALAPILGGGQTWVLSAHTYGVRITFQGHNNVWPLSNAVVCLPRERPLRRLEATDGKADGLCDERRFEQVRSNQELFDWTSGTTIVLRKSEKRSEILVQSGSSRYQTGTLIIVSDAEFERLGTMSFAGAVEIGNLMSTGAKDYLLSGNFHVRELGVFGHRTNVVKQGEFAKGDVVSVVSKSATRELVDGFGHITLSADKERGLVIVFISANESAALRINALGQDRPAILEPYWLERALTNSFLVVLALFATLVGSFVQLFESLSARFPKKK